MVPLQFPPQILTPGAKKEWCSRTSVVFSCRQSHDNSNKGLRGNSLYYSKKYKDAEINLNPSLSTS